MSVRFRSAVARDPSDHRSWVALGEAHLHRFAVGKAVRALEAAVAHLELARVRAAASAASATGASSAVDNGGGALAAQLQVARQKLFKARAWGCDWRVLHCCRPPAKYRRRKCVWGVSFY